MTPEGNAEGSISTIYTGLQYDDEERILYETPEKQKENLYRQIELPTYVIKAFSISQKKLRIPELNTKVSLSATKYATLMGNRLLLPLNMLNKTTQIARDQKERKSEFRLRYAYCDYDSVCYHLPDGFKVEFLTPVSDITSEFGTYSAKTTVDADHQRIFYVRTMCMKDGIFSPEKFKAYADFIKTVSAQDKTKLSLIRTTP